MVLLYSVHKFLRGQIIIFIGFLCRSYESLEVHHSLVFFAFQFQIMNIDFWFIF